MRDYTKYTDKEIREAWSNTKGQGNKQAREGRYDCIKTLCTEKQALALTRIFVTEFNIPSCCYYTGVNLTMYYGDAGSAAERVYERLCSKIKNYFSSGGE